MALTATTSTDRSAEQRDDELRQMLTERGRALSEEVHGQLRGVRADVTARSHDSQDDGELADNDLQRMALKRLHARTVALREGMAKLTEQLSIRTELLRNTIDASAQMPR